MLEKAAHAIKDSLALIPSQVSADGLVLYGVTGHADCLVAACKVLDLLTARPTERMISAGLQECTHAAFAMDADDVQRIYEAMTAALIKEGVPNA